MATASPSQSAQKPQVRQTQLFIDGQWTPAQSGKTFITINPATEEVIAQVAEGDAADVEAAVHAARRAFDEGPWPRIDARERGRMMLRLCDLIEEEIDELAALEALDNGKPFSDARHGDIPPALDALRYCAGRADKIHGQTIPINGSGETAQIIMRQAADSLKRLTFELGGKSPSIVFADAELDAAAVGAHVGIYLNQGRCCCAGSRLFVEDAIHGDFVDRVVEMSQQRKVGDPFDPATQQGPQVDKAQFDKIMGSIEAGKRAGGDLRYRREAGGRSRLPHRADGVYRSPETAGGNGVGEL
jgi:acyl-CoA reductase-like NAD-dependent aldehyde dehydrogenase